MVWPHPQDVILYARSSYNYNDNMYISGYGIIRINGLMGIALPATGCHDPMIAAAITEDSSTQPTVMLQRNTQQSCLKHL